MAGMCIWIAFCRECMGGSYEAFWTRIKAEAGNNRELQKVSRGGLARSSRAISRSNIRNYSIYLKGDLLFSYFEYHGSDYRADMAKVAADAKTKEWWVIMIPMQEPLSSRAEGEWWAAMEEVFHTD